MVISLSQEFANKNQYFTDDQWIGMDKSELYDFFNDLVFTSSNINWYGAFHKNTDNPHIILLFERKLQNIEVVLNKNLSIHAIFKEMFLFQHLKS